MWISDISKERQGAQRSGELLFKAFGKGLPASWVQEDWPLLDFSQVFLFKEQEQGTLSWCLGHSSISRELRPELAHAATKILSHLLEALEEKNTGETEYVKFSLWPGTKSMSQTKRPLGASSLTPGLEINNEDSHNETVILSLFSLFCISQISQHQYLQSYTPSLLLFSQHGIYFDGKGLFLQLGEFEK